ncbi:MAG: bifunctional glutamate N-acetyltransferase/amino-acid acetyltransferase ArgJ [Gemmatales bacterium]|nr:bifunctional glutamate N-acetyltransferase/amino-acid acetyltransferase ArgJ [Gemmatales bacterium]MDW8388292.1 bifunctional glutamate N-acetyltransferase/amino-acid acetyltransferase ArgJ [Gemmatales bacterium]
MTPLPRGYLFAGIHSGLRSEPGRRDLALIVSRVPAAAAGVFTVNRVCAAPVQVSRRRVPRADARGIVICSGNANACTGRQGVEDALRMAAVTAEELYCDGEQILVCSTGIIGRPLPMPTLESGIRSAAKRLSDSEAALNDVAHAILTTDTRPKIRYRSLTVGGVEIRLTGIAKGAAMIGPHLATMLGFVLTDADVAADRLQAILRKAADRSFNCISVEGHMSTNDTVLLLANGQAEGASPLAGSDLEAFAVAVEAVCGELAREIANDAEGISHLIMIDVEGARTEEEARRVAKTIAESALVKTAIFGADPNWGRIVSAAGYSGVEFREEDLSLWLGDLLLYDRGMPVPFDAAAASAYLRNNREVCMKLVFTLGTARCRFYTCDLGYEYIRLNAEYTT